jgi:hypothetical protein
MIRRIAVGFLIVFATATPAFAGWYLMEPPILVKQNVAYEHPELFGAADRSYPMRHWDRQGVFDTAKECTAARETLLAERRKTYGDAQRLKGDLRFSRAHLQIAENSECFASNDPRLLR